MDKFLRGIPVPDQTSKVRRMGLGLCLLESRSVNTDRRLFFDSVPVDDPPSSTSLPDHSSLVRHSSGEPTLYFV